MENLTADIVGHWKLTKVHYQHLENGETVERATDNSPQGNIVVFNDDGTGIYDEEMTWEIAGNELAITDEWGTDRLIVEILTTEGLEVSSSDHYEETGIVYDDLYRDTYRRVPALV